jgi:Flp pilus assembly protein TadG
MTRKELEMFHGLKNFLRQWCCRKDGTAAVEAALVFPLLLVMLLGTYDMGNAILSDQKLIRASQVTADLVTRERSVDSAALDEAVEGGELAMTPQNIETYGVDIVSVSFDNNSNPSILWRETRGNITPDPDILNRVTELAEPNGGVVIVVVEYTFEPIFGDFVFGDIPMQEVAFARGRQSAVVSRI